MEKEKFRKIFYFKTNKALIRGRRVKCNGGESYVMKGMKLLT